MSNFSKIVLIIVLVLSFFFIKEKINFDFGNVKISKIIKKQQNQEQIKKTEDKAKNEEYVPQKINIYFLALDSNDNGIYKIVQREVPQGENKLDFAIKELLKGPNIVEKAVGTYSEIPVKTRLLGIKENKDTIIINFSSDFQYGGGTDSIYSRMMQLIKTTIENSNNKKIYLYLDDKQIKFIGGEGLMITQPLSEKSLEI